MNITLVYSNTDQQNLTAIQLDDVGYTVNKAFSLLSPWFHSVCHEQTDLLIFSIDHPDESLLNKLTLLQDKSKYPIIIFAHDASHEVIEKTIIAGADSCVVGSLTRERILSVIEVSIARNKISQQLEMEVEELKREVESLENRLSDRKDVDRAKGLLMSSYMMEEADAYNALRKMAMDTGNKLGDVARNLISMSEILN